MVRQSPYLPYAHKLTKLSDDVALKADSFITLQCGCCSKDWDVTLPQTLSNSPCSLIGGHVCHNMFHKVVTKDQNVNLVGGFNSIIISMLVKSTCSSSNDAVTMMGHIGALAQLDTLLTVANCLLHLGGHSWPPELVMKKAQCLMLTLVSSISVTSVHGSHSVSLGDHKLQNLLQFTSRGVMMVKGSLVEC